MTATEQPWSEECESSQFAPAYVGPGVHRGDRLANFGWRLVSGMVDYWPLVILIWIVDSRYWLGPIGLAVVGYTVLSVVVMQGYTGQSLGKRLLGLQLYRPRVDPKTGHPYSVYPGMALCALRLVVMFALMGLCCIGFFGLVAPWWRADRRTWADGLVGTLVRHREAKLTRRGGLVRDI